MGAQGEAGTAVLSGVRVFDSTNPTGEDTDLGAPNASFGGTLAEFSLPPTGNNGVAVIDFDGTPCAVCIE